MDRINPRSLFVKKNELLNAVLKKPDLCVLSWEVTCRYVAFWTMFVCLIVHGWWSVVGSNATPVFFNNCFRYSFSYILTLLSSASVLWIGTMYMPDSLSMLASVSYSGYLVLLHEAVYLASLILLLLLQLPFRMIGFFITLIAQCYVNYLNIYNFYSVSMAHALHV